MAGDNIGRVSVTVDPEFDQAELFRQVKAATAKIPRLQLKPSISSKDVNAAVREVNQKKLAALKLPVSISVRSVNQAVREVNAKKTTALKLDVKFSRAQIRRALKEASVGAAMAAAIKDSKSDIVKAEDANAKARRRVWEAASKFQADQEVNVIKKREALWKNSERRISEIQRATLTKINKQNRERLKSEAQTLKARQMLWNEAGKRIERTLKSEVFKTRQQQKELDNMWKNAARRRKEIDRDLIRSTKKVANSFRGLTDARGGIGRFAANFTLIRSAFGAIKFSTVITGIGLIAQAASAAAAAITELTASLSFAAIGGLVSVTSGALAFGQALSVVKLASGGVGKALGGLNKELDPEKFSALTPAAKEFALEIEALKPSIRGLQQLLQEGLFPGVVQSIQILTPLIVRLAPFLQTTAETLGLLAVNAATAASRLGGPLSRILSTNNIVIENLGNAVIGLAESFIILMAAAGPLAVDMSEVLLNMSKGIKLFIRAKNASGDLAKFLFRSGLALRDFGSLLKNFGRLLFNILKAALPFGLALTVQLSTLTDSMADFLGSAKGQNTLTQFFASVQPAIREVGLLLRDITYAFFRLANQPGLLQLVELIRTVLLPALTVVFEKITREFGPIVIQTITNIIVLFATLASQGGPLNALAKTVGNLAAAATLLFQTHPGLLKVAAAIFLLETVAATGGLLLFIGKMSGLTQVLVGVLKAVASAVLGAGGTVAAFGRLAGIIGVIVFAVQGLIDFFTQYYQLLNEGHSVFESFARAFSFSILKAIKLVLEGFDLIFAALEKLSTISFKAKGIKIDLGSKTGAAAAKLARREIKAGVGEINKLNKINAFVPTPEPTGRRRTRPTTPEGPAVPIAISSAKEFARINAETEKQYKQSMKLYKGIGEVGIPTFEKAKKAVDPVKDAIGRTNDSLAIMRNRLSSLGDVVSRQRELVDSYRQSLDDLKNVQLEGTKAFDDQRFALDQQIKSLELQQVQLKIAGQTDESQPFIDLQTQIEALQLQAQQTDLTEALQLEPLRRQFKDATDPIKELSFTDALTQFQNLTKEHEAATGKLATLQGAYDKLDASINRISDSVAKTKAASRDISSGLSAAVSAPAIIEKPLAEANKSLTKSNKALRENAASLKTSLTQPVRQAGLDINRILSNLPNVAAPGATRLINWMTAIGSTAGMSLIAGLMDGMRASLKPGSDFFKLLHEEIPNFIRENKGPVEYDRGILVPAGMAIMDGLTTGLRRGFEPVKGFLNDVGPSLEEFVPDGVFGKRTAEFLIDVAAGKRPDPNKFFADLVPDPVSVTGGISDPRLGFLHKTLSVADTGQMAASLAKTFGGGLQVTALKDNHSQFTSSGNTSDHFKGLAADISNGSSPTPEMDALSAALKPLFGTIVKQLIWRDRDQNKGYPIGGHMNHVHVAFLPAAGFSLNSGKIGKSAASGPYASFFAAAAQQFGIDARLLQAVTKAESGFNPTAGSGAGARGLMQLLPATFAAQHVGSNIFDPKQNIFAGAKYLAHQIKTFKDLRLALAAYNAGPGNASLALRSFGETIRYVANVLGFLKDFGGFREHGGMVNSRQSFVVGERGPELFMPKRNGFVMSNKDIAEMISVMREIRDTGGLRQQTTNISTASQDPAVIQEMLEIQRRRRLRKLNL